MSDDAPDLRNAKMKKRRTALWRAGGTGRRRRLKIVRPQGHGVKSLARYHHHRFHSAGTAGAPACVMNAINDALRPLHAQPLTDMPFTPGKILRALGKV